MGTGKLHPIILIGPVIIKGFPCNSCSPFPKIVQFFPAGTPQFPVPVVLMELQHTIWKITVMVFFYQNCSDQLWADVICTWMFSYLLHLKVLSLFVSSNWISRISAFFNFMLFSICAIFFLILKRGSQRELPFLRSIIFKRRSVKVKVVIYNSRGETCLWIMIWDLGWFWAERWKNH